MVIVETEKHQKQLFFSSKVSKGAKPFPAGDHKAHINIRTQRHSKHKTEQKH